MPLFSVASYMHYVVLASMVYIDHVLSSTLFVTPIQQRLILWMGITIRLAPHCVTEQGNIPGE